MQVAQKIPLTDLNLSDNVNTNLHIRVNTNCKASSLPTGRSPDSENPFYPTLWRKERLKRKGSG